MHTPCIILKRFLENQEEQVIDIRLVKEFAQNTGELPLGDFARNSAFK